MKEWFEVFIRCVASGLTYIILAPLCLFLSGFLLSAVIFFAMAVLSVVIVFIGILLIGYAFLPTSWQERIMDEVL